MRSTLAIVIVVLCALVALTLLLRPPRQPMREVSVREMRDTIWVVRRVERPVIRYKTVPRMIRDTVYVAEGRPVEFVRMTHDTVIGGDTIRIVAEYPPPRLGVWLARGPVQDTLQIARTWLETTREQVQRPNRWYEATWFMAGVASGILLTTLVK